MIRMNEPRLAICNDISISVDIGVMSKNIAILSKKVVALFLFVVTIAE